MNEIAGHGSLKTYRRGCRCVDCRGANARYQREYQKQKAEAFKKRYENVQGVGGPDGEVASE